MEFSTTIYNGQEFSLDVGTVGLSVHEGFTGKCDGLSILNDAGSQPLEWGIALEGDRFGPIIISQGSEEGFLQLGLDFLEAGVSVLVPCEAILLLEEGM